MIKYKWYNCKGYAYRKEGVKDKRKTVYLHRQIMGYPDGVVDHINRDRTDNRRENLRIVTHTENLRNNGREYPNISWHKSNKKWQVYLREGGKLAHHGYFSRLEDAIKHRDEAVYV